MSTVKAAADSNSGLLREVNEDRFYCDVGRGLFIVIDGVGGQAAGGKAADTALAMLRTRLERQTGPTTERVREAIAIANNEIHRLARLRPEWDGMACVLTVAVRENGRAIVGHVGDTRLYKVRHGRIQKITRDHSPVGEREDANEISEPEAMRHPRRNEVYRDVGSEPHEPSDVDFIDLQEIPFEADAALVLCSDGLTDLVSSSTINQTIGKLAGRPEQVVRALIEAANDAGGKDNVTVVYVEGERFAPARTRWLLTSKSGNHPNPAHEVRPGSQNGQDAGADEPMSTARRWVRIVLVALLALVTGLAFLRTSGPIPAQFTQFIEPVAPRTGVITVLQNESIAAALDRAQPGDEVVVEPGEYRERLLLKAHVRVRSRVPRAATLRLPGVASEDDAAVVATGIRGAEFSGFRILGDAATPLGTGLSVQDAELVVVDVEIAGAVNVAVDVGPGAEATLLGSDIHDNPGTALAVRSGGAARVVHNVFMRNGTSERAAASLVVDTGARPDLSGNVLQGINPHALTALDDAARAAFVRDNWFPDIHGGDRSPTTSPSHRQGR
jgi:PPM family protein phosphatase